MTTLSAGYCALFFTVQPCVPEPLDFKAFYAQACYQAPEYNTPYEPGGSNESPYRSYWAGGSWEHANEVTKRVLDGVALYQDYLRTYNEVCKKDTRK